MELGHYFLWEANANSSLIKVIEQGFFHVQIFFINAVCEKISCFRQSVLPGELYNI